MYSLARSPAFGVHSYILPLRKIKCKIWDFVGNLTKVYTIIHWDTHFECDESAFTIGSDPRRGLLDFCVYQAVIWFAIYINCNATRLSAVSQPFLMLGRLF